MNPLPTRGTGAGPRGAVPCPRLPRERQRCPCPKRHSWAGLVLWITFPLAVFLAGSQQSCEERPDRRGAARMDLDPAVPGSSSGPTGFPGRMLWHCPTGLMPAVPPAACPMLAVLSSWGCPCSQLRFPARSWGCQRGVVSLLSVPAGCDFNELPPGLTPVCLLRPVLPPQVMPAGLWLQLWGFSWDTSCSKAALQLKM